MIRHKTSLLVGKSHVCQELAEVIHRIPDTKLFVNHMLIIGVRQQAHGYPAAEGPALIKCSQTRFWGLGQFWGSARRLF